jgi:cobalt/nickel transport system ATP-binding protein
MSSATPILSFSALRYTYPGQQEPALSGLSLAIPAGSRVVLLGRNGCGKSTLLLHCNGILRPDGGQVLFDGRPLRYDQPGLRELRGQVGLVFQQADDQLFSASVAQDLSFGPLNLGLALAEVRRRVQASAELCGITELLERPTHALSLGQKTRAALAGVLAMEPRLLLADELTASLDPWMRRQLFAIFSQLTARGVTIMLATHDLSIAQRWADLVVLMAEGQVLAAAAPEAIFADPSLRAALGPTSPWDG